MSAKLRIALLQLNPQIGQVAANIERANKILSQHLKGHRPDLVIVPELAFTGYNFKSAVDIEPYLEVQGIGLSSQWAKDVSSKFGCHTLVGYPEKSICSGGNDNDKGFKIYNSAILIAPSGSVVFNYRKTFLYEVDEQWGCNENPVGFQSFETDIGSGDSIHHSIKVQIGICMDLNPYQFKAPFTDYEFANSVMNNEVNVVLCPMAWLHSKSPNLAPTEDQAVSKAKMLNLLDCHSMDPDLSTVNYWLMRMNPLINKGPKPTHRIVFAACNRAGWEGSTLFAGSTSLFAFNGNVLADDEPLFRGVDYYSSLGQLEESLLYQEVDLD